VGTRMCGVGVLGAGVWASLVRVSPYASVWDGCKSADRVGMCVDCVRVSVCVC
jgi:hypothetical protein